MRFSVLTVLWATWAVIEAAPTPATLTSDLWRAESVREIKNLQKTYAQLATHGLWADAGALFAEDGVLQWGRGKPGANILDAADASSSTGPAAITAFLKSDAGDMDGIRPGSLHVVINEMPVITLSADGKNAKGRWHTLQFMGNGAGKTRIIGGLMENQYTLTSGKNGDVWKIKLLRYYPMFEGDYKQGWSNVGNNSLPIVPYHYTAEEAGNPILSPLNQSVSQAALTVDELKYRISRLNDEDDVRNLQHTAGHYVDRRMWPDVVDLVTADGIISVDGKVSAPGPAAIQSILDHMGPEGLTRGILNDHPIYQMIVEISPSGLEATSRGFEIGMIGDSNQKSGQWQFCVFRHRYAKDVNTGIWKIKELGYTRLMVASYAAGWSHGGLLPANTTRATPPFLNVLGHLSNRTQKPEEWVPFYRENSNSTQGLLADLHRRLSRSTAFDETENVSSAYGYYTDDIRCLDFATLHASNGFKQSPGVGWYQTPERISQACAARYGNGSSNPLRPSIPFHWRIQPVILVSHDGRSANTRIRNLQTGTSNGRPGGFNGGMYHDQFVLEEKDGVSRRKIWCLTIDEFYWNSASWSAGWAGVNSTALGRTSITLNLHRRQGQGIGQFVADVALKDPKMGPREVGFIGGPSPQVSWPSIQRMWWSFRNPVSGRVPESYWPGCVPCKAKPEWYLTANGYQEPATGPTNVTATAAGLNVTVTVSGGPDEPVAGVVQLRKGNRSSNLMGEMTLSGSGNETIMFELSVRDLFPGRNELAVYFLGSDRLQPGKTTVVVNVPSVPPEERALR
ncbi:SnoaL-like domain-containing protein [Madurella fahalii]|uniref:SnoaL-like domain-containing protein n=1 Tax=Madurella fahalii TaxID=1157608 RepID=A0ABQ0G4D0_9PEZI